MRKSKRLQEVLSWSKATVLRMGRIHLDCIESTVCGLAAQRKIAFCEGENFIARIQQLRLGKGSKEEHSLEEILSWSEKVEKLSIAIQFVAGKALHKHAKIKSAG